MCQATLGRVIEVLGKESIVNIKGKRRKVITELLDVEKGDYVLCSLNLAVEKVDPKEAEQMIT
jgi:hydrogenase maturation factor